MIVRLLLIAAVSLLYLGLDGPERTAFACSCVPPRPPAEDLEISDAVFRGTVIAIDQNALRYNNAVVFDVDRSWKGISNYQNVVTVITGRGGGDCGYHFEWSKEYVVYASASDDGSLDTGICSGTKPVEYASEDLAVFGAGIIPSPVVDEWLKRQLHTDDGVYEIRYMLSAGELETALVDLPAKAILLVIDSPESAGTLTVELPRNVIDARVNALLDARYDVQVGHVENGVKAASYQEAAPTFEKRMLVIDYPQGSGTLVVIDGTVFAPTFIETFWPVLIGGVGAAAAAIVLLKKSGALRKKSAT